MNVARPLLATAALVALAGCGSSSGPGALTLARTYAVKGFANDFAVGARATVYVFRVSARDAGRAVRGGDSIHPLERDGSLGPRLHLGAGVELRSVAADGAGMLYAAVRADAVEQVWALPEGTSGDVAPAARFAPDLPGEVRDLFFGPDRRVLHALCAGHAIVRMRLDGTVVGQIGLPERLDALEGCMDTQGNLYLRPAAGPVVKLTPDGQPDPHWPASAAAVHPRVFAVAADRRGYVYLSFAEGDVFLRAYDDAGALAFNVTSPQLVRAPKRLATTPGPWLYTLTDARVLAFKP